MTHAAQSWFRSPPAASVGLPEHAAAHSFSMYSGLFSHSPPLAHVAQFGLESAGPSAFFLAASFDLEPPLRGPALLARRRWHVAAQFSAMYSGLFSHS